MSSTVSPMEADAEASGEGMSALNTAIASAIERHRGGQLEPAVVANITTQFMKEFHRNVLKAAGGQAGCSIEHLTKLAGDVMFCKFIICVAFLVIIALLVYIYCDSYHISPTVIRTTYDDHRARLAYFYQQAKCQGFLQAVAQAQRTGFTIPSEHERPQDASAPGADNPSFADGVFAASPNDVIINGYQGGAENVGLLGPKVLP